jgi:putative transposase
MRFEFIAAEKANHAVGLLCRCLDVTRSGFYAWAVRRPSKRAQKDEKLRFEIRTSFYESRQTYGSPRILEDLREQKFNVSRKRVMRLMRGEGLVARRRRRFVCTTMSGHGRPVAANLLNRQFTATAANERWVGDTTEFRVGASGKVFLAAILDLFSRFVVGWAVSVRNDRYLVIDAFEMATKRRCPDVGLLHHSDQGSPYASEDYQERLAAAGITCSMSRRANCYDKAVMESFFSTVKCELGDRFPNPEYVAPAMFDYIEVFYNQRRRHSTLGQISPAVFERRADGSHRLAAGG